MGLLGKYAVYQWVSGGNGGGGDSDGIAVLVIIGAIIAAIAGILWAVTTILSIVWNFIYGLVRPVLIVFPPVTVPLAVILIGWLFTLIGPYPTEKMEAFLDGTDDKLSFTGRSAWALIAINSIFIMGQFDLFPEANGVVGIIFALVVALFLLYGLYEVFHLPYRCTRLLLHAPGGTRYVIAFLSPVIFMLVSGAFNVSLNIPVVSSISLNSEIAVAVGALTILNATYLGGVLAVLWKQDEIHRESPQTKSDTHPDDSSSSVSPTSRHTRE
ncbi:hypothetical protein [Halobellus ordinarius]|uniref:hypothetical protein n=1 Tax=Halobellus ordinarius TaxID=3075120 RepID=UPI0028808B27|nr:hypothetical protein [Halobellus sp. ZY16]